MAYEKNNLPPHEKPPRRFCPVLRFEHFTMETMHECRCRLGKYAFFSIPLARASSWLKP